MSFHDDKMTRVIHAFLYFVVALRLTEENGEIWTRFEGARLIGSTYRSVPVSSSIACGHHCAFDQRCLSVNYMTSPGTGHPNICEMNERKKGEKNENIEANDKYTYYEPVKKTACPKYAPPQINLPAPPNTCPDLLRHNVSSGTHLLTPPANPSSAPQPPRVCHVEEGGKRAWTLVMAFTLEKSYELAQVSLDRDAPRSEDTPNFALYRMSREHLVATREESTQWRALCNYHGKMDDDVDTVRAEFTTLDPFHNISGCGRVEYINVRGHSCQNCTALWFQENTMLLHVDSQRTAFGCDLNATDGAKVSEDNWGFYAITNPTFKCTEHQNSTTSWWFG